jgi:hypothetical protein
MVTPSAKKSSATVMKMNANAARVGRGRWSPCEQGS